MWKKLEVIHNIIHQNLHLFHCPKTDQFNRFFSGLARLAQTDHFLKFVDKKGFAG